LEKTLLDINLDMIGRSKMPSDTGTFHGFPLNVTQPGEVLLYSKHESSELMKTLSSAAEKTGIKVTDMGEDIEAGGSDHESFWARECLPLCSIQAFIRMFTGLLMMKKR